MGVPRAGLCPPLATVLQSLGVRRGMVVCGLVPEEANPRLDELSTLGANTVAEFYQPRGLADSCLAPANFPVQPARWRT